MLDKDNPEFWREIIPGSTITLTDTQAIDDSVRKGGGVSGTDYMVESVWKIMHKDRFAEWLLFKLDDEEQELWLIAKIVDREVDLAVFFEPDEFRPGNRRDLVEQGDTWLFNEPDNPEDFEYDELEFVNEIIWEVESGEGEDLREMEVSYRMKGQRVLYGYCTHDPIQSGLGRIMASVIEYRTDADYDNSELMLLELGGEHSREGGLITMLIGCPINFSEVDVLKAQPDAPVTRPKLSIWEKMLKKMS